MKRYKIREGSIAEHVICAAPLITFILVASICHALTGTW